MVLVLVGKKKLQQASSTPALPGEVQEASLHEYDKHEHKHKCKDPCIYMYIHVVCISDLCVHVLRKLLMDQECMRFSASDVM